MYYWWIFFVLTWVWEKEKNWVLIETQCHTPVYCTCRFYSLRFDSSQGVRCMTRQKNHLSLHSNLVNSTVSSTRKARIWNVMMIYQLWVFQLRWKVMFTLLTHTLFNSWWVWAYNILNVVFPKILVVILPALCLKFLIVLALRIWRWIIW